MKIGIDISQIIYQGTGVGRFIQGLTEAILKYDKKNHWFFFFSSFRQSLIKDIKEKIKLKGHRLINWKLPSSLLSFLFNDFHLATKPLINTFLPLNSLDWFITSDWIELPLSIKKATIVHDLAYLRYPQTLPKKIIKTQEKRLHWVKNETEIIFADSNATKDDLINYLKIDPQKIIVNYPGVTTFTPPDNLIKKTLKKYQLEKNKFILTVGKIEPRKNIERLIQAFNRLDSTNILLVIVGPSGWGKINFSSSHIKYLSYIEDVELYSLYSTCLFFVYPSLWEGFGYPIIEAMLLKAPVVCSNTSSMKEIAQNCALFFNPFDVEDIRSKMKIMLENDKLKKDLINKGKINAKRFTWENYYHKLIKTLSAFK